jgi:hypothetical protein
MIDSDTKISFEKFPNDLVMSKIVFSSDKEQLDSVSVFYDENQESIYNITKNNDVYTYQIGAWTEWSKW